MRRASALRALLFAFVCAVMVTALSGTAMALTHARLNGTVLHGGQPLTNTMVWAYDTGAVEPPPYGGVPAGMGLTGADGRYDFDLASGAGSVKVAVPGPLGQRQMAWWRKATDYTTADVIELSEGETYTADFDIPAPGTVAGTVNVSPGYSSPLAEVMGGRWSRVQLFKKIDGTWIMDTSSGVAWIDETEAPARYRIGGVAPGVYRIGVVTTDAIPQIWPSAEATSPEAIGAADVTVTAGTTATANFGLRRAGHIVGSLTAPAGRAASGKLRVYTAGKGGLTRSYVTGVSLPGGPFTVGNLLTRATSSGPILSSFGDYVLNFTPDDPDVMPVWWGGTTKFDAMPIRVEDSADTTPVVLATQGYPFTLIDPVVPARAARRAEFWVSGAILPLQPTGQRTVQLRFEHQEKGAWVDKGYLWANPTKSGINRRYGLEVHLSAGGAWRIRAKHTCPMHKRPVYSAGYGFITVY